VAELNELEIKERILKIHFLKEILRKKLVSANKLILSLPGCDDMKCAQCHFSVRT